MGNFRYCSSTAVSMRHRVETAKTRETCHMQEIALFLRYHYPHYVNPSVYSKVMTAKQSLRPLCLPPKDHNGKMPLGFIAFFPFQVIFNKVFNHSNSKNHPFKMTSITKVGTSIRLALYTKWLFCKHRTKVYYFQKCSLCLHEYCIMHCLDANNSATA